MKNKLMLAVLPALLVLSACGVKPAANQKVFVEDTAAHEEVFGAVRDGGLLGIRKADEVERTVSAPDIGYQIHFEDGKLAIRFVAAIKETTVKAYWRRGVAAPDGTAPKNKNFSDATQEASSYYLELTDGQTTIKAGQGKYADYVGFVVYTLRNIPYSDYEQSYVAAYLNLVDGEDDNIHNNSKGLAVKVEKKNNYESVNAFAFDPTVTGHFLEGTIGGVLYDGGGNGLYRESSGVSSTNNAWYEGIQLVAGDSFGSFYYEHDTLLKYCGFSSFFTAHSSDFQESSLSGYASPKKEGKYNLYLSKEFQDQIYSNRLTYHVTFYFDSTTVDSKGWSPAPSGWFIHAFNGSTAYSGNWGDGVMHAVADEDHLYEYILEMAVANSLSNVILGFKQGNDGKQTIDLTCTASDTAVYDIDSDATWDGSKMNATISAR